MSADAPGPRAPCQAGSGVSALPSPSHLWSQRMGGGGGGGDGSGGCSGRGVAEDLC